ncbi:MAG: hypothetical protein SRB1_02450 [Desulfobacteraceae bacterium Eth-SRB1]|nr:MAG: hypothetical protein SRB1_02450 [Desulfobacteraceae bacterium Eth-SRB1]
MDGIRSITRGIIYKGLATGMVTLLGLATSIVLARYFGKDEYGKLIIVYTVVSFFAIFTNFGIGGAIIRFLPKYIAAGDNRQLNIFSFCAGILVLFFSSFFSAILFFSASFIATVIFHRPDIIYIIQIGSIYLFCYSLLYFMSNIFQGLQKWQIEAPLSIVTPLIYFFGILLVTIIGMKLIDGVLYAHIFAIAVSILLALIVLYKGRHLKIPELSFETAFSTIKDTLVFSLPLIFSSFTFYLMIWFDRLILGASSSNEELISYYIATMILSGAMMMFKVLFTVLSPYVAEIDPSNAQEIDEKFKFLFKWFFHISILFAIAMFFIADPLIIAAYGDNFSSSALIFKVLLVVFILRSTSNPIHMFLVNVFEETKEVARISVLVVIVNVILNLFLIPLFSYWGAVSSSIISYSCAWVYMASRIESIKKLLPVGLIRKSSISLGLIILVNILSHAIGIHNIWLLFIISLFMFMFLQWLQKELQGEDFDFFMKVVRASLAGVCKKDTL